MGNRERERARISFFSAIQGGRKGKLDSSLRYQHHLKGVRGKKGGGGKRGRCLSLADT